MKTAASIHSGVAGSCMSRWLWNLVAGHRTDNHSICLGSLTRHVLQYSMYGHIQKLAEAEKKGIEKAGGTVDLYQ